MSKVARALGIGRSTLYRKLREYGLEGAVRERRGLSEADVPVARTPHRGRSQKGEQLPPLRLVV